MSVHVPNGAPRFPERAAGPFDHALQVQNELFYVIVVRTLSERWNETLDGFVPQGLAHDPDWAWRARNVARTSFLMSGVFTVNGRDTRGSVQPGRVD